MDTAQYCSQSVFLDGAIKSDLIRLARYIMQPFNIQTRLSVMLRNHLRNITDSLEASLSVNSQNKSSCNIYMQSNKIHKVFQ